MIPGKHTQCRRNCEDQVLVAWPGWKELKERHHQVVHTLLWAFDSFRQRLCKRCEQFVRWCLEPPKEPILAVSAGLWPKKNKFTILVVCSWLASLLHQVIPSGALPAPGLSGLPMA